MSIPTSIQNLNRKLITEEQHQPAIIHLGQLALSDMAPAELMNQAAVLFTQILPVDHVFVWQLLDDQKHFLLLASAGLHEAMIHRRHVPIDPHSMKAFCLKSPMPIVVENVDKQTHYRQWSFSWDNAVSGMCVLIGTPEKPHGVIEVLSPQVQAYSESDIMFLQSAANIIGVVLDKVRREEDLLAENQMLRQELLRTQYMTQSGHFDWQRYEIKSRLVESREKERLRLAQDLHDIPIQDLYGLMYQLDDLKEAAQAAGNDGIVDEFKEILHRVVNSLRAICRELRPPSLSPFGLEVAIRDHVEKFQDQNPDIKVNLELMSDKQVLSDGLRLGLFRIYQQAMHNVARHAQATEIDVRFSWDDEMIILEVEDNGRGFEVPEQWMDLVHQDHFGLLGIAERVESIRGKLEIVSALGSGTLIRTLVPRS